MCVEASRAIDVRKMYKPWLGVALHVLSSQRYAAPSEIGMTAIMIAAVEKAGDELCSFHSLMHRNLAARTHALLPHAPCFRRMASWLVRALLRGGKCRGLGWTAGVPVQAIERRCGGRR
jgi:hypothetical protein